MNKIKFALLLLNALWLLTVSENSYGRYAAIVIDADNGNVLNEVEATQAWYPASLTKLMTLYMTFDALKAGKIGLKDTLTASAHASRQPNSKLGLRRGEHLTVEDAILAVITRSANDVSVVLAEHLGGSEANFADKMTAKAKTLGMHHTRFMNATGLPNQWQVTTPRDMAVLAWKTQRQFPEYYHYFGATGFNYKGAELRGINKFTANYPGAEGMKTGFTCGSGFNLIGSANQNGKRLIGVVMGGMTSKERYRLMMQQMDDGFIQATTGKAIHNITTMPTGSAGSPPYQLDCGKGAPTRSAKPKKHTRAHHTIKASNKHRKHTRKSVRTNIKTVKSKTPAKSAKTATSGQTAKRSDKNKNYHKANAKPSDQADYKNYHKADLKSPGKAKVSVKHTTYAKAH